MTDIKTIPGFNLFKTEIEQKRAEELVDLMIQQSGIPEKIKWLVPNMAKNPEGKVLITGFFIFFDTIICEFKDFLSSVSYDYAKYVLIKDIRMNLKEYGTTLLTKDKMLTVTLHHTIELGYSTIISVFGASETDFVLSIIKSLYRHIQ